MSHTRTFWMLLAIPLANPAPALAQTQLKVCESKYYIIHSDLDPDAIRDTTLRITKMAEEYDQRTRVFGGKITYKLPFYLFRHRADYHVAGGPIGSLGVFKSDRLLAIVGDSPVDFSRHIVQHEGFHQFVHMVIGGHIPVWVNEGLAEYFGETVFTGDGYVTGLIPPERLKRVKKKITDGALRPLHEIMLVDRLEWNREMSTDDYDLAWSMVQFLAHGENGKYERVFNAFLRDVGRTGAYERAWTRNFGPGIDAFQQAWRNYWLNLPDDPTAKQYAEATVKLLTSSLARATSQGQTFESAEAFFEQAKAGKLLSHSSDRLPPSLLVSTLDRTGEASTWSLDIAESAGKRSPKRKEANGKLTYVMEDGTTLVGHFTLAGGRVRSVTVETR